MRFQPRIFSWLYRKLGRRYPKVYLGVELLSAFPIILGAFALFSFYYEGSFSDYAILFGFACAMTAISIAVGLVKTAPMLSPIEAWIGGKRDPDSTSAAWAAAVSFPWRMLRRLALVPIIFVVIPVSIFWVVQLDLPALAILPIIGSSLIALGYSAILHYLAVEAGLRPVLIDINQEVSPRTAGVSALSLRWRLLLALPLINLITGVIVAALTSDGGGGGNLGIDAAIALGVTTTVALELTVLFSKSILRPIHDLQQATESLVRGDYDVAVPITTGDELGDLAASFNQMARGLAERERIREAFGTYLDREVAEYILSEGFDKRGIDVEVSVLFCDVVDFTGFAAGAEASEVVAALNRLFEVVVPIVGSNSGHVDKFVGDGILAVFGAPKPDPDHADCAVRAACEIARRINGDADAHPLRVGIGVNSGRVVAGSVGGAGRLNFSVIGDAVNVAARVEAVTREVDAEVLITAATVERLRHDHEYEELGPHTLKGVEAPVDLYAPRARVREAAAETVRSAR